MAIRPLPVVSGPCQRSAADHELSQLFAAIRSARVADRLARRPLRPGELVAPGSARLTLSLGVYAKALEQHRLPVPPVIRDELRLRNRLSS